MAQKSSKERQREYKARMYEAGYRQVQIWVPCEPVRITRNSFLKKLDELTAGWNKQRLSELYGKIIQLVEKDANTER